MINFLKDICTVSKFGVRSIYLKDAIYKWYNELTSTERKIYRRLFYMNEKSYSIVFKDKIFIYSNLLKEITRFELKFIALTDKDLSNYPFSLYKSAMFTDTNNQENTVINIDNYLFEAVNIEMESIKFNYLNSNFTSEFEKSNKCIIYEEYNEEIKDNMDGVLGNVDVSNINEENKKSFSSTIEVKFETDKDYISWDTFFMSVAYLASLRSKDPATKVGAVIVKDKRIISTGYNGMPFTKDKDNDDVYPWAKTNEKSIENKYYYVVHAEENAILSSPVPVRDGILYCTLFPCNECAKAIIQSGITEVVYNDFDYSKDIYEASKQMLLNAGIKIREYRLIKK